MAAGLPLEPRQEQRPGAIARPAERARRGPRSRLSRWTSCDRHQRAGRARTCADRATTTAGIAPSSTSASDRLLRQKDRMSSRQRRRSSPRASIASPPRRATLSRGGGVATPAEGLAFASRERSFRAQNVRDRSGRGRNLRYCRLRASSRAQGEPLERRGSYFPRSPAWARARFQRPTPSRLWLRRKPISNIPSSGAG